MMKMMPVEEPSPVRPNVFWYAVMALMAPMSEESNPLRVETRYPIPMIPYSWIMFRDHSFGF